MYVYILPSGRKQTFAIEQTPEDLEEVDRYLRAQEARRNQQRTGKHRGRRGWSLGRHQVEAAHGREAQGA